MNPDNNLQLSYFIQNEIKQTLPWGKPESPYPPVRAECESVRMQLSSSLVFLQSDLEIYWFLSSHCPTSFNHRCVFPSLLPMTEESLLSSRSRYVLSYCWLFQLCFDPLAFTFCEVEISSDSAVTIRSSTSLPTLNFSIWFRPSCLVQVHVQPQTELFGYVIKQLNSRDLAFSLVGIARSVSTDMKYSSDFSWRASWFRRSNELLLSKNLWQTYWYGISSKRIKFRTSKVIRMQKLFTVELQRLLLFDLDQLHLWTVAAYIVLVYVQNGCITLNGILNTVNIKVVLPYSSGLIWLIRFFVD